PRVQGRPAMSTFYLLPPRADLAARFNSYLQTWFPGAHPPGDDLHDVLADTAERCAGAVVVFADDLPGERGPALEPVLCAAFGAETADRVIDLRDGPVGAGERI